MKWFPGINGINPTSRIPSMLGGLWGLKRREIAVKKHLKVSGLYINSSRVLEGRGLS